jgi:hypothetical protein
VFFLESSVFKRGHWFFPGFGRLFASSPRIFIGIFFLVFCQNAPQTFASNDPLNRVGVELTLTQGETVRGRLIRSEAESVLVELDKGVIRFPRNRIVRETTSPLQSRSVPTPGPRSSASPDRERPSWSGLGLTADAERAMALGYPGEAMTILARDVLPESPALAWQAASVILINLAQGAPVTTSSLESEAATLVDSFGTFSSLADIDQYFSHALALGRWLSRNGLSAILRQLAQNSERIHADRAAPLFHLTEYQDRLNQVQPNDFLGAYRLGQWAERRGLLEEARTLFTLCSNHDVVGENARLQLDLLARRIALKDLEQLRESALSRDQAKFDQLVAQFRQNHNPTLFQNHLRSLVELQKALHRRNTPSPSVNAEAALQDAQRLLLAGQTEAALGLAQQLRLDFAGTPAGHKAQIIEEQARQSLAARHPAGQTPPQSPGSAATRLSTEAERLAEIDAMARKASMEANRPSSDD